MTETALSDDFQSFILKHLDTIAQLEALLLLRSEPQSDWDVQTTAGRLYAGAVQTELALKHLVSSGFLTTSGTTFRYGCHSDDQASMVEKRAKAYSHHLIAVTNLIHNKPPRIQQFADAFNLRKDK